MCCYLLIMMLAVATTATMAYMPAEKEHFITDALLREVVERMGKDWMDAAYLDFPETPRMGSRAPKDLGDSEERLFPLDYDALGGGGDDGGGGGMPSLRDREYLQHSSLWGSQFVSGGAGEGVQRLKPEGTVLNKNEIKTDSSLPAYCNPPNPCPVGYGEEQGCTNSAEFENTAAYSRRYQAAQDCMCDTEHMFDCPNQSARRDSADTFSQLDFNRFLQHTFKGNDMNQHKSLVAKKYHIIKSENQNPYLVGERLPVAAKKGHNVVY